MKFLLSLLATSVCCIVLGMFTPWWTVAIAAGSVGALMHRSGLQSFFSGFLGVALAWLGITLWINHSNGGIFSARMAQVLPVGGQVLYLHLITALLGGLIGGLAAWSGTSIRSIFNESAR